LRFGVQPLELRDQTGAPMLDVKKVCCARPTALASRLALMTLARV
jgi:hypothetical protein